MVSTVSEAELLMPAHTVGEQSQPIEMENDPIREFRAGGTRFRSVAGELAGDIIRNV